MAAQCVRGAVHRTYQTLTRRYGQAGDGVFSSRQITSHRSKSRLRDGDSECLRGLLIDYQFEFSRLLDWELGGLCAAQEYSIHARSSNVIESSFATVRDWTDRTKGCVTRDGMLAMIYKLGLSAKRSWRPLRGFECLAKVVERANFRDEIEENEMRVKQKYQPSTIAA